MPSRAATELTSAPLLRGGFGLALAALAAALPAQAQSAQALAESLFQDGKRLMDEGKLDEACPKLADSERLDPAPGTLLALALCHDLQGRTATAWAEYSQALDQARQQRRADREQVASQRLAELKPQLSRLTVAVPPEAASLAGLAVRLDGVEFPRSAWGEATPVDPGKHTLEASAPQRLPFKTEVILGARADAKTVQIPPLKSASPPAPAASSAAIAGPLANDSPLAPPQPPSRTPWASYALLGGGAAVAGAGLFFSLDALSKRNQANETCPRVQCADEAAREANRKALRSADVATVLLPVGVLMAGAGLYLTLSRPSPSAQARPSPSLALSPAAAPGAAALWLRGSF